MGRGKTSFMVMAGLIAAMLAACLNIMQRPILPDETAGKAVELMWLGMQEIKAMRAELGVAVDPVLDPARSGFIGVEFNDLTTTIGDIRAKQTSLNPQFAALIVMWLKKAGVRPGDQVALCMTGSFPALNLAAMSACEAMNLRAVSISSVGASSYGANIPGFSWLDMEKRLYEKGLISFLSRYVSLGGIMDTEGGLDGAGYALGEDAIVRHGGIYLREGPSADVSEICRQRMAIYSETGLPKAFVNVGGALSALGWINEAALLENGLLYRVPASNSPMRGLIFQMFEQGVPVIHLLNIERLAAANHLEIAPRALGTEHDVAQIWRTHALALALLLFCWFGLGVFCLRKSV